MLGTPFKAVLHPLSETRGTVWNPCPIGCRSVLGFLGFAESLQCIVILYIDYSLQTLLTSYPVVLNLLLTLILHTTIQLMPCKLLSSSFQSVRFGFLPPSSSIERENGEKDQVVPWRAPNPQDPALVYIGPTVRNTAAL